MAPADTGVPSAPAGTIDGSAPPAAEAPDPATLRSGLIVSGTVVGLVDDPGKPAKYLEVGAMLEDATAGQRVRLRFQVAAGDGAPAEITPGLEVRRGAGDFAPVALESDQSGPFHMVQEWWHVPGRDKDTEPSPLRESIAADELRIPIPAGFTPVRGEHSMGANPAQTVALGTGTVTEIEFTVTSSRDLRFDSDYDFRLTDGNRVVGDTTVRISVGTEPPLELTPGQRIGRSVPDAESAVRYALVDKGGKGSAARYRLAGASLPAFGAALPAAGATAGIDPVHGPYGVTTDSCATCHRTHTASGPNLSLRGGSVSMLCFLCHDGTGAPASNVKEQYTSGTLPQNNPAQREYYSHAALEDTNHRAVSFDEFGGRSDRHSECTDCHNPHRATSNVSAQTPDGWITSGRLVGNSGVQVANSATPGAAPTYTFLDGQTAFATLEYQLCFKCHSGFTTLASNTGFKPTQFALDKGVEFNPNNQSFHPVEAPGKNVTTKMADSLAGTSPYKLWNFAVGSTIRCVNCHASSSALSGGATPAAGSDLPPHTSTNRGILLANYADRVLKPADAAYSAGDFALCYLCHAEAPFSNETSTATNFPDHGRHTMNILRKGTASLGSDINTAGAGSGNALCAECHFRIHSTSFPAGTQALSGSRLVNFSPNVRGRGALPPTFTKTAAGGSCALVCHGQAHDPKTYP
jgi:predicted CXXCH cytochrome family protein